MPLIARERELELVVEQSRAHRLVTIVGPGGVGKTTLARAAADVLGSGFAFGVRSVDLTRVDDPAGVPELIAGQLGFADFDSLVNSPSDQPALILIDNCEHVLDAAADAIDEILSSCRMPSVLATSRSPLDVVDEVIAPLAPLEVPPDEYDTLDVGAMQMFRQRVVDFGGQVGPDDTPALAEICRRLDGVPLALEIAAPRSRTRTLDEILDEIGARPSGLSRPRFRGHSAHRSVTDMVDWSLLLLSDDARRAFDSSVGLGRRGRATGTDPERARSAVTQRIRATISRLDELYPGLGGHLATSVETGRFCVYRPIGDHRWRVER